jgi:uncharacterized membrane protein YfcA
MSLYVLAGLFFWVSALYASLGLGGGTIYVPLLAIFGMQTELIPTTSLGLNIVATTVGSVVFLRAGFGRLRLILPFALSSVPCAYLGGRLPVDPTFFHWFLIGVLGLILLKILFWERVELRVRLGGVGRWLLAFAIGAVLGLTAGIAGIGGGIFLIPAVTMLQLGTGQEAAACAAVFTWANSVAGMVARVQETHVHWDEIVPLIVAVVVGSILGASVGAKKESPRFMQPVLGVILFVAIVFLLLRVLRGV